tara:strand:- start:1130 stop:1372 length:243 start_codon:yes stop_codon:yes gene_type:complete
MKQNKLTPESLQWIKDHPKEFIDELIRKSELVKNFSYRLEPLRKSGNKEEYNKRFNELLKKEEDKINGRKNNQTTTNEDV